MRTSIEIESIVKDLYRINSGPRSGQIKFDEEGITYLNSIYDIKEKVVIISSINCYLSNRIIFPFKKNEQRTSSTRLTYSWNNAYQNIKHDRINNLKYGSLRYLFDAMAALFLLNIYFKNESFPLGKSGNGESFPNNQGSDVFSIKLYTGSAGVSLDGSFHKPYNFSEFVYRVKATASTAAIAIEAMKKVESCRQELVKKHLIETLSKDPTVILGKTEDEIQRWIFDEGLRGDIYSRAIGNRKDFSEKLEQVRYEAIVIKNETI